MYGYMGHKLGLLLGLSVDLLIHRFGSVSGMEWCFLHHDLQLDGVYNARGNANTCHRV